MIPAGSKVLLVTDDANYAATVNLDSSIRIKGCVGEVALCVPLLKAGGIDALLIKLTAADETEVSRLLSFVALSCPDCTVYMVDPSQSLRWKATELGIRLEPLPEGDLPVFGAIAPKQGRECADKILPQQFVSVWSPKGGVGKTFVACNLGVVLSQLAHSSTLLMDLDWDSADAFVHFELTDEHNVLEILPLLGEDKKFELAEFCCKVKGCPLLVMPGPPSPELSELVRPGYVNKLLQVARRQFGIVVADLPPHGYSETICQCLEESSHIVLVTSQDVSTLRQTVNALRLLRRMGIDVEKKVKVIVNRFTKESPVSLSRAEEFLGVKTVLSIPECRRDVEESVLKGIPIVLSCPKLDVSVQLRKLGGVLLELDLGVGRSDAKSECTFRKWFRR
ncbi:MAG TPA: P-loop NTPase [Firmicutes bacterium]|nr:P-loop NTPase [Bacillota bacterium]